jgi:hypothetical protein
VTTEAGYDDHSSYPASVLFGGSAALVNPADMWFRGVAFAA